LLCGQPKKKTVSLETVFLSGRDGRIYETRPVFRPCGAAYKTRVQVFSIKICEPSTQHKKHAAKEQIDSSGEIKKGHLKKVAFFNLVGTAGFEPATT
jgi:hypothetical protein